MKDNNNLLEYRRTKISQNSQNKLLFFACKNTNITWETIEKNKYY